MLLIDFTSWWMSLNGMGQLFWGIAIFFSIPFIIQFAMSFIGLDADTDIDDLDGDIDGDFHLFSIKSIIAFFTFFGWSGVALMTTQIGGILIFIGAIFSGIVAMLIVTGVIYFFSKMQETGTLRLDNAIDKIGEVYINIPENRKGTGRVQIKVQGSLRELDAMTDGKPLKTGGMIRVITILNDRILLVEPADEYLLYS